MLSATETQKEIDKQVKTRETIHNNGDPPNTHSPSAQGVGGR